jgi:hypothetical protein
MKRKAKKTEIQSPLATTTTNLPGLEGVQVIVSKPILIKENSSKVSKDGSTYCS